MGVGSRSEITRLYVQGWSNQSSFYTLESHNVSLYDYCRKCCKIYTPSQNSGPEAFHITISKLKFELYFFRFDFYMGKRFFVTYLYKGVSVWGWFDRLFDVKFTKTCIIWMTVFIIKFSSWMHHKGVTIFQDIQE